MLTERLWLHIWLLSNIQLLVCGTEVLAYKKKMLVERQNSPTNLSYVIYIAIVKHQIKINTRGWCVQAVCMVEIFCQVKEVKIQGWLVGFGLTSHSAIFQLYSDGTVVQFPNFDLLPGTQRHGQLGVFSVPSLPRHGHRDVRRLLLPPCHQRVHTRWG